MDTLNLYKIIDKEKITQGFNLYELADYFDVDIKYMIDCIDFYTAKYGILV